MFRSLVVYAFAGLSLVSSAAGQTSPASKRVSYYYQTQYDNNVYVSLAPIWQSTNPATGKPYVTDLMVAAFHFGTNSDGSPYIHLNDNIPQDPMFTQMWAEVATLQSYGVPVRIMLGGSAPGTYSALFANFSTYYPILKSTLLEYNLNGIDLDIEENVTLANAQKLVDQLSTDFGPNFIQTMAPVASALWGGSNLSGFSYLKFAASPEGQKIAWYNAQFYSGFATMATPTDYEMAVNAGFPASQIVAGMLDNSADGGGFTPLKTAAVTVLELVKKYPTFGGVSAWEYFNALPGGTAAPQEWATYFSKVMSK